jgi:hypothetical protein
LAAVSAFINFERPLGQTVVMAQIWGVDVDYPSLICDVDLITVYFIEAAFTDDCTASSSQEGQGHRTGSG